MSSFNNDYKKDKEEQKQDNSYFTFLAGIIIIFVIRYFIIIYKRIFYKVPYNDENKYINCHCSKCKERYNNFKLKIKSKNINKTLIYYICAFLITIFLFIECCNKAKNSNNKRFDPFEILEISEFATTAEIKKAYKTLSLKYHPDKNLNNKEAKEKFMNINKAYRALTNEKAKENYKKYGNPDGPGLFSYGYALPFFLFQGKVGSYILIIFSILMVVVFPILFLRWNKNSKKYNNYGILSDNSPFYYNILNKDTQITELPYIIGMSKEFTDMDITYDENEIKKIYKVFVPYFPKDANKENISFKNILAISMLYIHYSGSTVIIEDNKLNAEFIENKNKVIEKSLFLIDQLIKILFELNRTYDFNKELERITNIKLDKKKDVIPKHQNIQFYNIKEFDFNLIKIFLGFRARIFHETNIKTKNDELLQFPDNKKNLEIFEKNNYISIMDTIYNIPKKSKLKYLSNYNDIEEILKIMPKYNLNIELTNTKFEEAGNLLTFNINIIRGDKNKINNDEQKELGFLHSNNYFDNYNEEAIIILYDKNKKRINDYSKINFEYSNEEKNVGFNMLVENEGKNTFEIYLFSLSYPGVYFIQEKSIEIKEKNDYDNNFIKNRFREVLSQEEFEENYLILNDEENNGDEGEDENDNGNEENHEHQN